MSEVEPEQLLNRQYSLSRDRSQIPSGKYQYLAFLPVHPEQGNPYCVCLTGIWRLDFLVQQSASPEFLRLRASSNSRVRKQLRSIQHIRIQNTPEILILNRKKPLIIACLPRTGKSGNPVGNNQKTGGPLPDRGQGQPEMTGYL